MRFVTKYIGIGFCVALLTACDNGDVTPIDVRDISDVAIIPNAGVGLSVESRAALNGNVDNTFFPANTDGVFAVTSIVTPKDGGNEIVYFANAAVNSGNLAGSGTGDDKAPADFSFANGNYFYINGYNHKFYAYSPAVAGNPVYKNLSDANNPTVEFTIDGQQDIMWAEAATNTDGGIPFSGDNTTQQPSFNFKHLLKKIRFKFIMGEGFARNIDVTTVRIVNLHERLSLNLKTGSLTPEGELSGTAEIHGTWAVNPKDISVELPNLCLMCEPGEEVNIEIVANQYKYEIKDLTLTSDTEEITPGGAGVSHLITVEFHATHIEPSSKITSYDVIDDEAAGNI